MGPDGVGNPRAGRERGGDAGRRVPTKTIALAIDRVAE